MTDTTTEAAFTGLALAPRRPSQQRPYWHRTQPIVAVAHLDPSRQQLKRLFPSGWRSLVRAKALLDGTAVVEATDASPDTLHFQRIAPLLTNVALELLELASLEQAGPHPAVVDQARSAGEHILTYVRRQSWDTAPLEAPTATEPHLFCGPLRTWATHPVHLPLALEVSVPRPDLQQAVDEVDAAQPAAASALSDALQGPAEFRWNPIPPLHVHDLILTGGEPSFGHKNFAHFFPLDTPGLTVNGPAFGIAFANVFAARYARCSLELLRGLGDEAAQDDFDASLRTALQQFRSHDLGHFWCRADAPQEPRLPWATPFEDMTLKESLADVGGLIMSHAFATHRLLQRAFCSELLRYLARRSTDFADSVSAVLTAGWLAERRPGFRPLDGGWIVESLPDLADLARHIHAGIWDQDPEVFPAMSSAIERGEALKKELEPLFRSVPTDIEYAFG
jgi:hypothetical protein